MPVSRAQDQEQNASNFIVSFLIPRPILTRSILLKETIAMCPSERSNHNRSMFTRPRLIIALQFLHLQFLLDLVMSLLCSFSGTIAGIRGTLLNGVASLLSLVTGLLLSSGSTDTQLVHDPLSTLL